MEAQNAVDRYDPTPIVLNPPPTCELNAQIAEGAGRVTLHTWPPHFAHLDGNKHDGLCSAYLCGGLNKVINKGLDAQWRIGVHSHAISAD